MKSIAPLKLSLLIVCVASFACVVENGKQAQTPPSPATQPPPTGQTPPQAPPKTPPETPPPAPKTDCPDEASPTVTYTSKDTKVCSRVLFRCDPGQKGFSNECGCGCIGEASAPTCPDEKTAGVSYKSKDAKKCAAMRFACAAGEKPFSNAACGCGCEPDGKTTTKPPPANPKCPEAAVAGVDYKSKDTSFCARARIVCPAGNKPFSSECGCGCVAK